MRLSYDDLIAPSDIPISLSIGNVKNHTLHEIYKHGINLFRMYEVYLKLTPYDYYEHLNKKDGKEYWDLLSDEQKKEISLYDILVSNDDVAFTFQEIFNFFFYERVVYRDKVFALIKTDDYETDDDSVDITPDNLVGIIHPKNFDEVLGVLQQVCCIQDDDVLEEKDPKFKNKKAKMLYEKMLKAKREQKKRKKIENEKNLSLPNIISSTAAKCPGFNIVNIWESTLFQLYDQFGKIQNNDVHYVNSVRVSVWGDEKNKYDSSLWYKNNYDRD